MISKRFTKYFLFFGVYFFTRVFMLRLKNYNDLICRTAQAVVVIIDYSVDYCWNPQRMCFSETKTTPETTQAAVTTTKHTLKNIKLFMFNQN